MFGFYLKIYSLDNMRNNFADLMASSLIWFNLKESSKCRGYMNFTAHFGITISNFELLIRTVSRRNNAGTCSTYPKHTLRTLHTSITKFQKLPSLACHLQMKTCPCDTTCGSAALSLTLYKTAFLLRLSSFSRKELFCTANFACFNSTLLTDIGPPVTLVRILG